jgi:O-antigen/teichoic acid export membrane protein
MHEKNTEKICALLNVYKRFYHVVGLVILIIGIAVCPLLRYLIKGDIPYGINLYIIYFLYLTNTVIGYFLFSYKASLFIANQRDDVRCNISTVCYTIMYIVQIVVLLFVKDYYIYLIIMPISTIANNIIQQILSLKYYPDYYGRGSISKEESIDLTKRTIGLISYKIGGVIYNNADTIVVSAFLGLIVLAKYTNYYYVITGLVAIFNIVQNAITASVGNFVATESLEKNQKQFELLDNVFIWISGWCAICLLCMFQPFMRLWMGEKNLLPFSNVVLFSLYFYFMNFTMVISVYKNAAGIWWEDKIRPLIGIAINVILNIWWVRYIGINGVILSSIVNTVLVSIPWSAYFLFKCYLKISLKKYLLKLIRLTVITTLSGGVTYAICNVVSIHSDIITLIVNAVICLIVPNVLYFIYFKSTRQLDEILHFVFNILKIRSKSKKYA